MGSPLGTTGAMHASETGSGADATGTPSGEVSSGGGIDSSSTSGSSTSGADVSSAAGDSSTDGDPCGNGVLDAGEECDDGNDDDRDDCTVACTVPTCDDGLLDGDETDLDCGGGCSPCALCLGCETASDCEGDLVCGASGQCSVHVEVAVDWVVNCPGQAQGVTLQLPGGTYLATAMESAGTLWLPPHNPPSSGYFYEAQCTGVNFEQLRTPEGIRYADVPTAFDAMISETETFSFVGGDFTCWLSDGGCGDNDGGIVFTLDSVCD